ncbi:unnamed protein product [Peronospora farinosa]|uniref:Glycerol-3-phosphate dehydrogenase NAD-dependent C-terminal domain-containing protein n=1 Tax=Peronospora farinosa TaxID=134698 RepID=A0ABN8BWD1_9STRA|nr:unnamed protein product [Peronospora farinosa]
MESSSLHDATTASMSSDEVVKVKVSVLLQSQKAEDLLNETNVEDVLTAKVAVYFAKKCGLDLPIFRTVNAMIKGHEQVQVLLMNWPLQSEI